MKINKFLYFGDFIAIPTAVAIFAHLAFASSGLKAAPPYFAGFIAGMIVWTFAEY